jgi:pimeloyl-ACP methyl ester carboxylesterase
MAEPELLHLVFVHGFQGDHTSFRSFPKDLHESLSPKLAARFPQIELKSSIYPTYKTRKLVTEASRALSIWLASQAPARFILFGHSMGGLVIAEAATVFQKVHKQRIFAVVAIDTPFLGMHPHVIISGLASLLPKGGEGHKSEREMNANSEVHMVTEGDIRRAESVLSAGRRAELDSLQVTRPVQPKPRKEISEWESYKSSYRDLTSRSPIDVRCRVPISFTAKCFSRFYGTGRLLF